MRTQLETHPTIGGMRWPQRESGKKEESEHVNFERLKDLNVESVN